MKRGYILILVVASLMIFFFGINYVGFVVNTPSSVTVDAGSTSTSSTSSSSSSSGGGGGGGGGASVSTIKKEIIAVDKDVIKVDVKQGGIKRETLEIINTGDSVIEVTIDFGELKRFVAVSEENFSIEPGRAKIINLDIFAKEDEIPEAYIGKIIIKANQLEKIINFVLEVQAKKPLFDIKTETLNKRLRPDHDVRANIEIINMGDLKKMDIILYYAIRNFDGDILTFKEESLAIEDKISVVRKLRVPDDTLFDDYIFYSKVLYENVSATSVDVFEVEPSLFEKIKSAEWFAVDRMLLLIAIIILFIMVYILSKKLTLLHFIRIQRKLLGNEKVDAKNKVNKELNKD